MSPPDAEAGRVTVIDGLRGLAVMGILLMNITAFAMPSGAYFNPLAWGPASRADIAIWAIDFVAVDGKMRALFSILFGASLAIVARRAAEAGDNPLRRHAARMATLALFGALHHYLLWSGDILLLYAIVGLIALPFTQIEPGQQIRIALLLLGVQALVCAGFLASFLAMRAAALGPHADAAAIAAWGELAAGLGVGPLPAMLREVALYRGPWSGVVAYNLASGIDAPLFQLEFDGPETLAFMLIGMAGLGSGFLSGQWQRRRYVRAAALGCAIGLPLSAALCWLGIRSGFNTLTVFAASTLGGVLLRPILALAGAALAILWLSGGDGPIRRRIVATGRTAFSNYLGTSLVMTALFYGWGFGLFGRIDRVWLYPIVAAAWLLMLGWSGPWLARFRYGPLEWLWRSLARGKMQPLRRNAIATVLQ
ncbi:MAG TPA: DUF418 domain-containing protein [Sphingomonas sp.]